MSRVFIETVGCPKNLDDSERMAGLLSAAGHEIVFGPDGADVLIVNTCGFIEAAKRESIDTILDYAPLKSEGKRLIVTGCLTQRYPEELRDELPEADAILGVNDYRELPGILSSLAAYGGPGPDGPPPLRPIFSSGAAGIPDFGRRALSPRYSSYLKLAEGCSNNCAYCIIPSIRGPYRSVPPEQVLSEAEMLAAEGCKELILIAQDLSFYGKDLDGEYGLPGLLRRLCASGPGGGIEWIRLLYCYAERVTDELIEVMAAEPKILNYIDIPLQHVSGRLLSAMRREGDGAGIRRTIGRLRSAMPDVVIRTTFITGLPGETEREFAELYDFVEELRFDRMGVFAYSPEEGTDAAAMPGQVSRETAESRRDALMQLQQRISLEKNQALVGTVQDVIVDGRDGADVFAGRTRGDAPDIDNAVIFSAPRMDDGIIGTIVKVRITDAMDYDLVGELSDCKGAK